MRQRNKRAGGTPHPRFVLLARECQRLDGVKLFFGGMFVLSIYFMNVSCFFELNLQYYFIQHFLQASGTPESIFNIRAGRSAAKN